MNGSFVLTGLAWLRPVAPGATSAAASPMTRTAPVSVGRGMRIMTPPFLSLTAAASVWAGLPLRCCS